MHPLLNASRWYKHIAALLDSRFPGQGVGVVIGAATSREFAPPPATVPEPTAAATAPETPAVAESSGAAETPKVEEDDDNLDLFGEETEEEAAAAGDERTQKRVQLKEARR